MFRTYTSVFLFMFSNIILPLVLLNLVIAQIGGTYARTKDREELLRWKGKADLVIEAEVMRRSLAKAGRRFYWLFRVCDYYTACMDGMCIPTDEVKKQRHKEWIHVLKPKITEHRIEGQGQAVDQAGVSQRVERMDTQLLQKVLDGQKKLIGHVSKESPNNDAVELLAVSNAHQYAVGEQWHGQERKGFHVDAVFLNKDGTGAGVLRITKESPVAADKAVNSASFRERQGARLAPPTADPRVCFSTTKVSSSGTLQDIRSQLAALTQSVDAHQRATDREGSALFDTITSSPGWAPQ